MHERPLPEPLRVERKSERPRIVAWRLHVLTKAGYPVRLAEELANSLHVDLHQAVEIVEHGCPFGAAYRILR